MIDNDGLEFSAPGFAFYLLSGVSTNQSGHTIYQIKAEYLSY